MRLRYTKPLRAQVACDELRDVGFVVENGNVRRGHGVIVHTRGSGLGQIKAPAGCALKNHPMNHESPTQRLDRVHQGPANAVLELTKLAG